LIFQKVPAGCDCCSQIAGCLCGDCSRCCNTAAERALLRRVKRYSALACCISLAIGFVLFVPVVSLGPAIPTTEGFSVQLESNTTAAMGSLSFCYFGQGAVVTQGVYYPVTKPAVQVEIISCPALSKG